ncbi:hypothetical protein [Anaerotignum sp.]
MYPYNLKTRTASIVAKERRNQTNQNMQNPDLSADRRLQELLQLARQDAAALEQKYTTLLKEELLTEAESILNTMVTDEKKHQRILREILFTIFSDTLDELLPDAEDTEPEEKDAEELLEELLFTEMDDITFYRSLLSALTGEDDLWNLIFEIITDKQNHTAALNHLYAKYFVKTTGN